jgi:hypothetical protein
MVFQKTLRPLLLASFVLMSGAVQAATGDGDLDGTSTGTVDINLTKSDLVKISGLGAVDMELQSDGNAIGSTTACIHRAGATAYNLTATGDGASNAFTITDGTDITPYSVGFVAGTSAAVALTSGTALPSLVASATVDCAAETGANVTFNVEISSADYLAAPAGASTGVLSLLVSPE